MVILISIKYKNASGPACLRNQLILEVLGASKLILKWETLVIKKMKFHVHLNYKSCILEIISMFD